MCGGVGRTCSRCRQVLGEDTASLSEETSLRIWGSPQPCESCYLEANELVIIQRRLIFFLVFEFEPSHLFLGRVCC